jgi:transcriptional regulator with XRE-family HTH domain
MTGAPTGDRSREATVAPTTHVLLIPHEVWFLAQTRKALVERDLTSLYRLARRYGYSQTRIAQAVGKSQPQVSEIMNAKTPHHASNLDVVHRHADAYRMPLHARLLFLGVTASEIEQEADRIDRREELKRRDLLRAALALSLTGVANWQDFSQRMIARMSDRDYLRWLAWELHLAGATSTDPNLLPSDLAEWAVAEATLPVPGFVCRDAEGGLQLVDHRLKDVLVAQTLSGDIVMKESSRFTLVQTSHATDRILERFVASDIQYASILRRWMCDTPNPTLRVNSAGVLAKIQDSDGSEAALSHLGQDSETRLKYITAVASRVLKIDWNSAERRAKSLHSRSAWRDLSPAKTGEAISALSAELLDSTDAGARWCSAVLLASFRSDRPALVNEALHNSLTTEVSREVIRVVGRSLAGKEAIG